MGEDNDSGDGDKKVLVYSTPTCPFCKMAKEFLKENNIEFEDKNVADDEDAKNEMMDKSGQMGVPVLDIKGKIIVGFDKNEISEALGISDESK
ncbi:NrdH-redoxin [Candidatus Woesearchaeota archaeon]|nr:NrdH-redoxin [Candidatus Woesearchaeota archaeon]